MPSRARISATAAREGLPTIFGRVAVTFAIAAVTIAPRLKIDPVRAGVAARRSCRSAAARPARPRARRARVAAMSTSSMCATNTTSASSPSAARDPGLRHPLADTCEANSSTGPVAVAPADVVIALSTGVSISSSATGRPSSRSAAGDRLRADVAAVGEQHERPSRGADPLEHLDARRAADGRGRPAAVHERAVDVEHEPADVVEAQAVKPSSTAPHHGVAALVSELELGDRRPACELAQQRHERARARGGPRASAAARRTRRDASRRPAPRASSGAAAAPPRRSAAPNRSRAPRG